jgi:hypothetical protein
MTTLYGHAALSELTSNAPDYEELEEGHSAKYNHATCPMGVDTRKRFGVKHVDDAYLWHCFNCGDSGYYRTRETVSRIKLMTGTAVQPDLLRNLSEKFKHFSQKDLHKFNVMGQLWLGGYGFTHEMVEEYNIREIDEGIVLPFGGYTEINRGYQLRRYDKKPKYVTSLPLSMSKSHYIRSTDTRIGSILVIVEDLLSAYKLHYAGYSTLCLLGTKLDKGILPEILLDNHSRVVLWLDDDAAGHLGAMKLFKELSPVFKYITSINMLQPKEIALRSLQEMEL